MEKYTGLEIAVIGISGRFPEAGDITEYWENLKAGRDSISSFSDEELLEEGVTASQIADPAYVKSNAYLQEKDHFDAAFFDYRPGESALMDPQMRIFHECCWEALEDSGYIDPVNNNVGVFSTGSLNVNWVLYAMLKNKDGEVDNLTASYLRDINFLSSRISYKFNLKGPSVFIQTACSSSLVTIHEACNSLLLGECSMALAGGVTVRNYSKKGYRYEEGMIHSKDGKCRPFDAGSSGTVGGEGAGVVVLKRLKDAIRDRDHVYAVIKGTGINNDGRNKVGYTAPSSQGQAEAIKKALKMAQISPQSIGYIETHGTATELGDPIEIEALNLAFASSGGARFCAIGSVKSNIGHLDNAAGIASFIKAVLVIKHGQIPASLHFNSPNPKIDFKGGPFYVNHTLKDWDTQAGPRRAGVSSFGIGGTNAHIILEQAPERQNLAESRKHQLLVLSGKTKRSLERNLVKLKAHLKNSNDDALADIAYTLQNGRSRFKYRKFVVCENKEEAIDLLAEGDLTNAAEAGVQEHLQNIVFMFPGQGAQYHDMCRDLYETESFFKEKVEECLSVASRYSIEDFKSALFFGDDSNKINDTKFTQPILFIIEYALAQLLMSWGIKPDYMIGHSIGEYVAACISGVFTLEDALKLVIRRGELMGQVERGSMLSIKINEDSLLPLLTERRCLDIAAVNGSDSIVVSGRDADVMNFGEVLTRGGYEFRKVSTSHAFHSHMMDDLLSEFEAEFTTVTIGQPRIPYISNITGMLIDYEEILKPAYWSRHLRNTVLFSSGAETLLKMGNAMFIEIGPGKTLSNYISQSVYFDKGHQVLNTVRHQAQQEKDQKYLIEKLGRLWQNGIKIDWAGYYTKEERSRISLPKYSFEKTSYTAIVDAYQLINKNVDDALPLLATAPEDLINISTWQRSVLLNDVKFPKEASVILVFCGKESFSNSLISDLVDAGQRVIEVRSGASFVRINDDRFQANILSPEDLQAFWNHLKTVGLVVDQVIYCVALDDHLTSAEINDI
jgi:acyl transferase domain-containing protein